MPGANTHSTGHAEAFSVGTSTIHRNNFGLAPCSAARLPVACLHFSVCSDHAIGTPPLTLYTRNIEPPRRAAHSIAPAPVNSFLSLTSIPVPFSPESFTLGRFLSISQVSIPRASELYMATMENHRLSPNSSVPSVNNIRQTLSPRNGKEEMSPALKSALELLKLHDFDALEHHFLGTIAFLKPWCKFRDSFLLIQPVTQPRASEPDKVRGVDILWFYTNFSDGELRYDPRADDTTSLYTLDESKYGTYNTTHWGVEEYEKMMYAWLLQEFKVGKAYNPFGFQYFELQNVCTAWKTVFVPIVDAVRESYDPRGRRHYGRLARFIEERHPSRVAFPEGNVGVSPHNIASYRVLSVPRERGVAVAEARLTGVSTLTGSTQVDPVTRKKEVALEQELRDIYPKYGQVVEKPKWRPGEFIATQKARMKRKNREIQEAKGSLFGSRRSGRESPIFGCKGIDNPDVLDPVIDAERRVESLRRSESLGGRSSLDMTPSPITKRGSKKEKGVVPVGMYGFAPSPIKDKTPLHGVTRRVSLPGTDYEGETQDMISHLSESSAGTPQVDTFRMYPQPAFARPETERKASDGVYSSIRNSNPFTENMPDHGSTPQSKGAFDVFSPMTGHPSAIPKALFNTKQQDGLSQNEDRNLVAERLSAPSVADSKASRIPSYEGTGYDREIGAPFIAHKLHSTLEYNAYDPYSSRESSFVLSEIPEMTHHLEGYADIPQPVPWPGMTPGFSPDVEAWPGQTPTIASPTLTEWPLVPDSRDASPPPPIPPKHPARAASVRSSTGSDLPPPPSLPRLLGPRIVSKENIRGHLSNISREISEDSLKQVRQHDVQSTPMPKLTPYNKNMFPRRDRKGTPVGAWMERNQGEMQPLEEEGRK
ncbi:hypothetical protein BU23DRAFT_604252 [Bimuria novae-zelandiae CBS 107.79]|uniref:Uncharacterized protein n=1 Tax=Bimuria novae-zelandiae CBS 107.79 TaxID=1447943 RepID=A0A6A5UJE5_9PLEO|nr:hypothetical protein BU23DRAFT_604252 [Bimuria novae-zelandiae CBS 107.79]